MYKTQSGNSLYTVSLYKQDKNKTWNKRFNTRPINKYHFLCPVTFNAILFLASRKTKSQEKKS